MSKREKIKSVFNYLNNKDRLAVDFAEEGIYKRTFYNHIKYNNFEEYLKENPDCCAVNPGGGYDLAPPSIVDQLLGFNSGDVIVINFKIRYLNENNEIETKEKIYESFI